MTDRKNTRVFLLYHFFHPDDVISARLYSDLAIALTQSGYNVIAFPSLRSCHRSSQKFAKFERWSGGEIHRIWRPDLSQQTTKGRLINSLFMILGWVWKALSFRRNTPSAEIAIIGTDPIFGLLAAIGWRLFRPNTRIIHWCHDVHPEASIADGLSAKRMYVRLLRRIMRLAYRRCDVVVDLGPCMRELISKAGGWEDGRPRRPVVKTITPWSLVEPSTVVPANPGEREALFGRCRLAMLYSGNLGRAHEFQSFLNLARRCRSDEIQFCFAGRGPGMDLLQQSLTPEDVNISVAGFVSESELQSRLAACDVHLVSLNESWTGTVVPSKFFGALSIGRPVLFTGASRSSIAQWIREYGVGWSLNLNCIDAARDALIAYGSDPNSQVEMQNQCFEVYRTQFSKQIQIASWLELCSNPMMKQEF